MNCPGAMSVPSVPQKGESAPFRFSEPGDEWIQERRDFPDRMKAFENENVRTRYPLPVTAVILAGGEGKRLGMRKPFLDVDGKRMIDVMISRVSPFCREILISCSPREAAVFEKAGAVEDGFQLIDGIVIDSARGKGPLEGLFQGMKSATSDWIFLTGCDMPGLMESVVRRIWDCRKDGSRVMVPLLDGYREALHSFYATQILPDVEDFLNRGIRKVTSLFEKIPPTEVPEDCFRDIPGYRQSFMNINTHEQLLAWRDERRRFSSRR
jgi:molybdopterin-guanine dinucleotide biosynthesis protein A